MPAPPPFKWFGRLLPWLLLGYLFFSKPFAYVHVPDTPIFVGEVVLCVGIAECVRQHHTLRMALAASPLLKAVFAFSGLCLLRLSTGLLPYKLDAVRDAALFYYTAYAFLAVALVRTDRGFLTRFLTLYYKALPWFIFYAPVAQVLYQLRVVEFVKVPGTGLPVVGMKPGDTCIHLAMAVLFLWYQVGPSIGAPPRRSDHLLAVAGIFGLLIVGTQNRGGLLSGSLALLMFGSLLAYRRRGHGVLSRAVLGLLVLMVALGVSGLHIELGRRDISYEQITSNVLSLAGKHEKDLNATSQWRERIWGQVVSDIITPRQALAGRGFGLNLYERYRDPRHDPEGGLRNPHNSHLSVLARTGLTGVALWTALWLVFGWASFLALRCAWLFDNRRRIGALAWAAAGVAAMIVNAFFDPSLEGPQVAVWLWVVVGLVAAAAPSRDRSWDPCGSGRMLFRPGELGADW
jgi:hypothetical protein